jgi:hypothetical protein
MSLSASDALEWSVSKIIRIEKGTAASPSRTCGRCSGCTAWRNRRSSRVLRTPPGAARGSPGGPSSGTSWPRRSPSISPTRAQPPRSGPSTRSTSPASSRRPTTSWRWRRPWSAPGAPGAARSCARHDGSGSSTTMTVRRATSSWTRGRSAGGRWSCRHAPATPVRQGPGRAGSGFTVNATKQQFVL